ncbi:MAG: flagellar hook-associated protein FlgK [Burkholderiales bacterium]|nr:flagellar hook-associated protein FlgK [Burkholderiales bacterium]
MGYNSLMSIGVGALAANMAAIQTTSNNISNANVAGYSRQTVNLATAPGVFTGAGFMGEGVDITSISRVYSSFLTNAAATAGSVASADSTRLAQLKTLEQQFQLTTNGIGASTNQLFSALSGLVNNPSDAPTRQVVVGAAQNLAATFNTIGGALDQMQTSINSQLTTTVAQVNTLAQQVAALNTQIAKAKAIGQPPNQLLDQRDQLISQISSDIQVSRVDNADGTASLFIAGGQTLVLGSNATTISAINDPNDPSRQALAVGTGSQARTLDAKSLGGGTIAGLLNFQNTDLVAGRNLIGQMATGIAGAMNIAQQQGLTLAGVAGGAMFSIGTPRVVPNANNAAGAPPGSAAATITDAAAVPASDYTLKQDGGGNWTLTSQPAGAVTPVSVDGAGNVTVTATGAAAIPGMSLVVSNAQPGDSYLIQPLATAADTITAQITNPGDIAAAAPLVASTVSTNTGTASVTGLTMTTTPAAFPGGGAAPTFPSTTETLTFNTVSPPITQTVNGVTTSYNYTVTSSISGTATPWNPGLAVAGANGFSLTLAGVPADGDQISVAPIAAGAIATNNGNATALLALQNASMVGGLTATNAWASAVSTIGVTVQGATAASTMSTAAAGQATSAQTSVSGVNMDEEAANLIQFQQSYQAAAKILQVAQSVFDTLLQTASASSA